MLLKNGSEGGAYRFNRYIVECKYSYRRNTEGDRNRFNRYIVECKFRCLDHTFQRQARFNRYIVECKCVSFALAEISVASI